MGFRLNKSSVELVVSLSGLKVHISVFKVVCWGMCDKRREALDFKPQHMH